MHRFFLFPSICVGWLRGLLAFAFGEIAAGRLAAEVSGVRVLVNGTAAPIMAVAPGSVYGVLQVNVAPPAGLGSGTVSAVVTVGGMRSAPGVTIAVK